MSGSLFAMSPIKEGSVERCVDSSRYFVLKVQNAAGKHAFIGVAFDEREQAFDFNVAIQEYEKDKEREERLRTGVGAGGVDSMEAGIPKRDLSLKEGEKISIKLPTRQGGERRPRGIGKESSGNGVLPPPPGSCRGGGGLLAPPPSTGSGGGKVYGGAAAHDDFFRGTGSLMAGPPSGKEDGIESPGPQPSVSAHRAPATPAPSGFPDDFGGFLAPSNPPSSSPSPAATPFPTAFPIPRAPVSGHGAGTSCPFDGLSGLGDDLPSQSAPWGAKSNTSNSDPFAELLPFK